MRPSAEAAFPAHPGAVPPRFDGPAPAGLGGGVLLLGSFDGVHRGHRALFATGRALARDLRAPLIVLQCDPHPRAYFAGATGFRIACGAAQDALLADAGADGLYAPCFDAGFAALAPEDFVARHLAAHLGVRAVICGNDFRFGHRRAGDVRLLARLAPRHGYALHILPEQRDPEAGRRISSSRIREAILAGDLAGAEALAGHPLVTGVRRHDGGWRFDPLQILPPDGLYTVRLLTRPGLSGPGLVIRITLHDRVARALDGDPPPAITAFGWTAAAPEHPGKDLQ